MGWLFLLPYVLLPLLLTMVLRWWRLGRFRELTYVVDVALLFFFPFWWLQWMDMLYPPPPDAVRCGNPQMGLMLASWIIFLPSALIIQWLANRFLLPKKAPEEGAS